jgi:drug/metabolite transporter (DMT)-like permease
VPVLLALSAAVSWGTSDFLGGVAARRGGRVNALALGTQTTGLVAFVPIAFLVGGQLTAADFWWALAGGMSSGSAIYLLYIGFTKSHTWVVAPIAAIGTAAIPACFGLVTGETLAAAQAVGVLLGLLAIWLISRPGKTPPLLDVHTGTGVAYGVAAGIGFAMMFIALDQLTADSGAWGVLPLRLGGVIMMLTVSLARRLPILTERRVWALVVAAGFIGSMGNLAFIVATREGNLSIVSVVGSLFPAATVALAYVFLAERIGRLQLIGVLAALAAVALVSAG